MTEANNNQQLTNEELLQQQTKQKLIQELKKYPIVQVAVKNCNVARSTFYRWKTEDLQFSKEVDDAINEGSTVITDMAESQIIQAIKDQNIQAIIFWLKSRHKAFSSKVELSGKVEMENIVLTPEQQALIKKALEMAGLNPDSSSQ